MPRTRPSLGDLLDAAQSETLDALSYIQEKTAGRRQSVASSHYRYVQIAEPIPRLDVVEFVVDFGAHFPGEVESFVRYAALRDAFDVGN